METDHIKDLKIKGIGKLLHGFVMLITYPVRHYVKFAIFCFVIVACLVAVPMIQGVPYSEITDWYLNQYQRTLEPKVQAVRDGVESLASKSDDERYEEVSAPKIIRKSDSKSSPWLKRRMFAPETPKAVPLAQPQAVSKRQAPQEPTVTKKWRRKIKPQPAVKKVIRTEKVIDTEPAAVAVLEADTVFDTPVAENGKNILKPKVIEDQAVTTVDSDLLKPYYRRDDKLPLVYEDMPKSVTGKALVFNANEISVGDTYIILYGIYTDPKTTDTQKAFEYLRELIEGKELLCRIVAYTHSSIATAVCFLDGQSINRHLTDAGFARNVAL